MRVWSIFDLQELDGRLFVRHLGAEEIDLQLRAIDLLSRHIAFFIEAPRPLQRGFGFGKI